MAMGVKEKQNLLPHLFLKRLGYEMWSKEQVDNWDGFLSESMLIGPPGAHSRGNIIDNINRFIDRQKDGRDGDYNLDLPKLSYNKILEMVVKICDNSNDLNYVEGEDWVSLDAFNRKREKY
jgi:hypothetical protein